MGVQQRQQRENPDEDPGTQAQPLGADHRHLDCLLPGDPGPAHDRVGHELRSKDPPLGELHSHDRRRGVVQPGAEDERH